MDYGISYTDVSLIESDGDFEILKELMDEDLQGFTDQWMVNSRVTIVSDMGMSEFDIDFFYDKNLYIKDYEQGVQDPISDFKILSSFFQEKGWNVPNIFDEEARGKINFWKKIWGLNLVNSIYIDKHYK